MNGLQPGQEIQRRPLMRKAPLKQVPLAALSLLVHALAQAAEPATPVPSAGTILQQNQPPRQPMASSSGTGLTIARPDAAAAAPSAPFPVNEIRISGNTRFDSATLHALVADVEGHSLTLAQLEEAAKRITRYYQDHGYPLARAVIPAQEVHGGIVQLLVVEARYGKIRLDNSSPVDQALLSSILSPLQAGQQIEQQPLDRSLLLLSDVPGVAPGATLKPGDAVGASDLQVDTAAGQTVTGNVSIDNYGNQYTGRPRVGGAVNVIDLLHRGDVLSLNVLSAGDDMNYGRLSEELLLNGLGTRAGASFSALDYKLGHGLSALGGHGRADVANAWVKHPFIRSRDGNLYGQFEYDYKRLDDDIDSTGLRNDRHLDEVTASMTGDWRDATGASAGSLALTQGSLHFDDAAAQAADALTARTRRTFSKWSASLNRVQAVASNDTLYVALSGQLSSVNLDASEKMVAGGPYTVRAYDMGALSGDRGLLANVEWRHELGQVVEGQLQAVVFFDAERITIDKSPWAAGSNNATLSGAGIGVNWYGPAQSTVKLALAGPTGSRPELIGTRQSVRAWLELDKAF
jgi:hemolysin activation/secretion protein